MYESANKNEWPPFLTIRQAARASGLPEHALRQLVKRGDVPGFYTGTRFLINFDAFRAQVAGGGA